MIPNPSSPPLLQVSQLRKSFGTVAAVKEVSFTVQRGQCLGLLGPNGAGKTTTISMILGLVVPDAGEVLIGGGRITQDTDPIKRKIGLVPQDIALYEELSGLDNLLFFGGLYGLDHATLRARIATALEIVGLKERARDKVHKYSGGMQRRLNLAATLLHDPELLLLDEPTVGVDPQSRNAIFDNIERLRAAGKTIIYTTHYMEEVERLCDQVVIIDHGRVIANDTIAGLKGRMTARLRLQIDLADPATGGLEEGLRTVPGVLGVALKNHRLSIEVQDLSAATSGVLRHLHEHGQHCLHLGTETPNLESVFLELTGHSLRDS